MIRIRCEDLLPLLSPKLLRLVNFLVVHLLENPQMFDKGKISGVVIRLTATQKGNKLIVLREAGIEQSKQAFASVMLR